MNKKYLSTAIVTAIAVTTLAVSFQAAADNYDIGSSYVGGSIVTFEGKTYRAKWHANAGQSPADVDTVANSWETPWELIDDGGNQAPTVNITSPAQGSSVEAGKPLTITASANDTDGRVTKVEFFAGARSLGADTEAPFSVSWNATAGAHSITAVATDDRGATKTSAAVAITAVPENGDPGGDGPGAYNPALDYKPGCVVSYAGENYRAKWHANVGQSPADVDTVADPWDTPWERTTAAVGCSGSSDPENPDPVDPDPIDDGGPSITPIVYLRQSELNAAEQQLTSDPMMQKVKESIRTLDNDQVEAVAPGRAENPANVKRVEAIIGEQQFEYIFPMRAPEYTYRGLLQAFAKFPAICATYTDNDSDAICRKTLATMFAHFAQETGGHEAWREIPEWRQALVHVREMGWNETMRDGYNGECNPATWQGQAWQCGKFEDGSFKSYFGRGAKQLSYNYNYGPFSEAMFGTVRTLLDEPALVADTWLNLASATFFFSYPQPPKPSMLHVIDGTWQPNDRDIANGLVPGFGVTTQIINGGVECGGANEHGQSENRIAYYREFAAYLNVPVPGNEVLGCKGMKQFDEDGAGALPIYWEEDYSWNADNPGGRSYACKLVGYQRPFSALKQGDYTLCVADNFKNVRIIDDTKSKK